MLNIFSKLSTSYKNISEQDISHSFEWHFSVITSVTITVWHGCVNVQVKKLLKFENQSKKGIREKSVPIKIMFQIWHNEWMAFSQATLFPFSVPASWLLSSGLTLIRLLQFSLFFWQPGQTITHETRDSKCQTQWFSWVNFKAIMNLHQHCFIKS